MKRGTATLKLTTTSEQLLLMTVRIEVIRASGEKGQGTGFFFAVPRGGGMLTPFVITNKHVVKDAQQGIFQVHEAETRGSSTLASGETTAVILDNFEGRWIQHPSPDVDLCAMPFAPIDADMQKEGKRPLVAYAEPQHVPSDEVLQELMAVEEVLMVGYPFGLWDSINNLPLVRRGITASHPAIDHRGRAEGVIDAACFPGSSGSPIFIHNQGSYAARDGALVVGHRLILLGALFAGPRVARDGRIEVREIPTVQTMVAVTDQMVHLGYYAKAREILTLVEHASKMIGAA